MNILCIETSTTNCSVAIASEKGTFENLCAIASCLDLLEDQSDQYSHGKLLHVFIDQILQNNQLNPSDLDAVAISAGPGSYTGLRIGVATAKGLCYALNIPMIAVDTLTSLSLQNTAQNTYTLSFIDARRMEVYASVFKDRICIMPPQAIVLTSDSFLEYLNEDKATIIGTGVEKFKALSSFKHHQFITSNPTALTMCTMAIDKMKKGDTVKDIAYFEPFYLKEFSV
jgi:tRNA threonylcarbamoyladenosine biosynthesis protein TsaB